MRNSLLRGYSNVRIVVRASRAVMARWFNDIDGLTQLNVKFNSARWLH